MPAIPLRRLLVALALAGLLCGCDQLKAKFDSIVRKATPELSSEEKAMNQLLEDPNLFDTSVPAAIPVAEPMKINKAATISILGYHDFRESGGTPMMIAGPKFRQQMQAIKDAKIPVIPLSQVLAWKRGEKDVPEEAIVITMDDGWEGVYKIAYPILKEFGFPFTVYLYKNYVNIGGRSMTWEEIKEMMQHGCEIGSHTVTHNSLTNTRKLPDADYHLKLVKELKESREFLEQNLGVKITSLAYPYGAMDETVVNTTMQVGYEAGVTVSPQKVSWDTEPGRLPRYIVHGEENSVFRNGTTFRSRGGELANKVIAIDAKTEAGKPMVELLPAPNSTITERRPLIEANLINLGTLVPESIRVRISGFGLVPATFDPGTFKLSYQIPIKLRRDECSVNISFKRKPTSEEELITWKFKIDLAASYLPQESVKPAVPVN